MNKQNSLKNPLVRFFSHMFFVRIKNPPRWVDNNAAWVRTEVAHTPYADKTTHFKGKNFIYKFRCENAGQGQCRDKFWVKKKRTKKFTPPRGCRNEFTPDNNW